MSGEGEGRALTVPKFASFKNKSKPPSDAAEGPDVSTSDEKRDRQKNRRRHHHSHRSHRHRDRLASDEPGHHSKRRRTRSPSPQRGTQRAPAQETVKPDVRSEFFVVDTKGDALIRKYGGIDRAHIVPYYRYGSGRILGSTGRLVIHRDGPRDSFSIRMPGEGSSMYQDKDGLRVKRLRLRDQPTRLRPRHKVDVAEENELLDGFLSLSHSKESRSAHASSSEDDERPSYRSIEGKAKAKTHEDEDEDSDSDSGSSEHQPDLEKENPLRWRSMQLSRKVKDEPGDIEAWMQLVDHQDALLRAGESFDHTYHQDEVHSYAEIKVSMLESALSSATEPKDRRRILVRLMREGVKVWSAKTASKKWEGVSAEEMDSFELWLAHVDFLTSNISIFQYDEVQKILIERLHLVLSRRDPRGLADYIAEAIYVFLRVTKLMHDGGYKELAVAAWQVLLESTYFRPKQLVSDEECKEMMQDFWESEVLRFGDAGARGWQHFAENDEVGENPERVDLPEDKSASPRDAYKAWGNRESFHSELAAMPGRTLDEGTADDPFRVVLFSDLETFFFMIPGGTVKIVSEQLIDSFLLFCGHPPAFRSSRWIEKALRDQFIAKAAFDEGLTSQPTTIPDPLVEWQTKHPSFSLGGANIRPSVDVLFAGRDWFQYLVSNKQTQVVNRSWLVNGLNSLVHRAEVTQLGPYYLALSFADNPSGVKRVAKALLKQSPMNEALYCAYARAEAINGNVDVSGKVLNSATKLAESSSQMRGIDLRLTSAMLALEQGNLRPAAWSLCSPGNRAIQDAQNDSQPPSYVVLGAEQDFRSHFEEMAGTGDLDTSGTYAQCLCLLAYLTSSGDTEPSSATQGNISAAMAVIETASEQFSWRSEKESQSHERLLQFGAKLLYLHTSKGPFRRAFLQEHLARFVGVFPQNTMFLSLFAWADSSLRVVDETRILLHDEVLIPKHDCVSSRMFSIQHELSRGNANSTRSSFESTLASDVCSSNMSLWISYIRFCNARREFRAQAKDIFYRALRHCPWSKSIMMEAFVTLAQDMNPEEVRSVYLMMLAHGLRVHVDLEEFLSQRRAESQGKRVIRGHG